jgi:hypothetical protein
VRSKGKRKISRWWLLEERNDEEKWSTGVETLVFYPDPLARRQEPLPQLLGGLSAGSSPGGLSLLNSHKNKNALPQVILLSGRPHQWGPKGFWGARGSWGLCVTASQLTFLPVLLPLWPSQLPACWSPSQSPS